MREFSLRNDLERSVIGGFAMPLGIAPGAIGPPQQGYTLAYINSDGDDPDTYAFHIVVSHERVREVVDKAFTLLPDEVYTDRTFLTGITVADEESQRA